MLVFRKYTLMLGIIVGVLVGCSNSTVKTDAGPDAISNSQNLTYYDLSNTEIPFDKVELYSQAFAIMSDVLNDAQFHSTIQRKNDWTYSPFGEQIDGEFVVTAIESRNNISSGKKTQPKLLFYEPMIVGFDVCRGFSFMPFKTTKSKGCRKQDGIIYRNADAVSSDVNKEVEFLTHEWLHAIGFSHAGNSDQCSKSKRNSVPIYVGCAARKYLDNSDIRTCSQSCNQELM